ncbi:MAG: hypothetical protein DID89_2727548617 [Candidatus Nitrotoga sp. CP45]|nr:MAG: hypothetical protein DID89_2727548617 [Candidatus Nitrotoga sp. CP45]
MVDKELLNAQKELTALTFGQAQAYTNVVLLAGYAGFFAIWSFIKPYITKEQVLWSGLLIALSLTAFMLWEIFRQFHQSRSLLELKRALNDPANFHGLLVQHKAKEQTRIIHLGSIWAVVFVFTILTGFSAIGILLWAFVCALWKVNYA